MTLHSTAGGMTLPEMAMREQNGKLIPVINILSKVNRLFLYAQWEECNNGTTYKGARTSTEPSGTWTDYDRGVVAGTATSTPYEEPTAMLDHIFVIDQRRKAHAANPEKFINDELTREMRGLQKQAMTAFFYGDRGADASYAGRIVNGLAMRSNWNTLSSPYVYDNAGGKASVTANKTSVWVMSFGPEKLKLIYPRGDAPGDTRIPNPDVEGWGIKLKKLANDTALDADSREFPADKVWFEQHWGICPHDPRYVVRIGNVSTSAVDEVDDFSFNVNYLIDALTDMPDYEGAVLACNRSVLKQIWKAVKDSGNRMFTESRDAFGTPVAEVCGLPAVLCDALISTEATLT